MRTIIWEEFFMEPYVLQWPINLIYKSGTSHVLSTKLGVNPDGNLVNAVDIPFADVSGIRGIEVPHVEYRFRQNSQQQSWEKTNGIWSKLFDTNGIDQADDPDPSLQKFLPKEPVSSGF